MQMSFIRSCRHALTRLSTRSTYTQQSIVPSALQYIQIRSFSDPLPPSKPLSPGGPDGVIPDINQQAVGKEYEELLAAEQGIQRFEQGPLLGPFGTLQSPAIVFSAFKSRIVGCVGGGGYPHRLLWFELKAGKKHVCRECGQAFKLQNQAESEVNTQTSSHAH